MTLALYQTDIFFGSLVAFVRPDISPRQTCVCLKECQGFSVKEKTENSHWALTHGFKSTCETLLKLTLKRETAQVKKGYKRSALMPS